jgi:FKBP-type peptidyl-prolyl cis-trans isomerase FkpA
MKILTLIVSAVLLLTAACGDSPTSSSSTANVPYSQTDLTVGTGRVAANGNMVTVNYTLWLYSATAPENKGTMVQTSVGGPPFTFRLGTGAVIKGWDQGVPGMAVGGKRRLVLPPSLAYGAAGSPSGGIPGNATLVFDIEVLNVTD